MDLPDINLWLALIDENHALHPASLRYWEENASVTKAFCRVTMLGFLRLSTQPRMLSGVLSSKQAWDFYHQFLADPKNRFLPEPPATESCFLSLTVATSLPHRLWTDAYLAAFALASGCRLVSFDSDFTRFPGLHFLHLTP